MKEKILKQFDELRMFDDRDLIDYDRYDIEYIKNMVSKALDEYADWKIKECLPENTTITSEGKDELYCEFFRCNKCKYSYITRSDKYCGGCGGNILANKDKIK